jgi:hypothetical protein
MSTELDLLERSLDATFQAAKAVLALAKEHAADRQRCEHSGDEWTRFPKANARCAVSNWSRSKVVKECDVTKTVRAKTVSGCRYYSLADVRRMLSGDTVPTV